MHTLAHLPPSLPPPPYVLLFFHGRRCVCRYGAIPECRAGLGGGQGAEDCISQPMGLYMVNERSGKLGEPVHPFGPGGEGGRDDAIYSSPANLQVRTCFGYKHAYTVSAFGLNFRVVFCLVVPCCGQAGLCVVAPWLPCGWTPVHAVLSRRVVIFRSPVALGRMYIPLRLLCLHSLVIAKLL